MFSRAVYAWLTRCRFFAVCGGAMNGWCMILLRIAILDDMPEHARVLGVLIERALEGRAYQLAQFVEPQALMDELADTARYDIVFLDIGLDERDGVELAQEINLCAPCVQIVFVSAYLSYVTQIYEAKHAYFLAKPVDAEHVEKALAQAIAAVETLRAAQIMLPVIGGGLRVFVLSEIVCCERIGRTSVIHTQSKREYCTPLRIKELTERLPQDRFFSPHASFLVALRSVRSISGNDIELSTGMRVPISARRREGFIRALEAFIL